MYSNGLKLIYCDIKDPTQRSIKIKTSKIRKNGSGLRKSETHVMRKVMRETEGRGGPWFEQYAIKKGIL